MCLVALGAVILFGAHTQRFKVAVEGNQPVFVVGLRPRQNYLIEVDDEEMAEQQSDGLDFDASMAAASRLCAAVTA